MSKKSSKSIPWLFLGLFAVAFLLLVLGYGFGKDAAVRDNGQSLTFAPGISPVTDEC